MRPGGPPPIRVEIGELNLPALLSRFVHAQPLETDTGQGHLLPRYLQHLHSSDFPSH